MTSADILKPGDRELTTSIRDHQPTFLNGHVTFVAMDDTCYIITIRYAGRVARENAITFITETWPSLYWERGPGFVTLEVELPRF